MALYKEAQLKADLENIKQYLSAKLSKLRAGRPRLETFADIPVEAYGTTSQVNALANIIIESATMVVIQPWDRSITNNIIDAVKAAELGFNPAPDGDKVRISIPPLTEERRLATVKEMKEMLEESKVSVRQVRQKYNEMVESAEGVSEDDQKRDKAAIQKAVDEVNKALEEMADAKEEEIMTV